MAVFFRQVAVNLLSQVDYFRQPVRLHISHLFICIFIFVMFFYYVKLRINTKTRILKKKLLLLFQALIILLFCFFHEIIFN